VDPLLPTFFLMVFMAVFLLIRATAGGMFGASREARLDLERTLRKSRESEDAGPELLRRPHLERLTPFEKRLEARVELRPIRRLVEQAGVKIPAYRVILQAALLALMAVAIVAATVPRWWVFLLALSIAAALPVLRLFWLRSRRISKIESQLADAIDMVKRSLRAGNPFVATFRMVAENMDEPIAEEFALTAADLSYGNDPRRALLAMLERVPSVALNGFVMAILVQRETGGNLAETLDLISGVIRQRFRFERRLRTLTAEGRMSAWILIAVPFVLGGILHTTSPDYLASLIKDPRGPTMLAGGGVLMLIGVLWIRRIARVVI
jgi:tight adherence protein B